ncbi:MAG: ABC transporter permease [Sedimentisphaerales bacterium]|nr:ABC transporter permease [Sedimentisphaerales bacterium]
MNALWHDIKYALRQLGKSPGFTSVAVLTLALGIGVNTAIFSVVNSVLLRALPFPDSDRLVSISPVFGDGSIGPASYPDFVDWRQQAWSFEDLAAYASHLEDFVTGDMAERLSGASVSQGFFALLRVNVCIGRTFLEGEDQPGADPVVVLSQGIWKRYFAEDPRIPGRTVRLGDVDYTVVGVLSGGFECPPLKWVDFWVPLTERHPRSHGQYEVLGRVRPGVTVAQARVEMAGIAARLAQTYPASHSENRGVRVELLSDHIIGEICLFLWVLMGATTFVLLIACANVAHLVLTRATARQKEMAVRQTLGASRWRIARQMLTENLLLTLLGGIAGVLLAQWSVALLRTRLAWIVPRADQISVDLPALGLVLLISLVIGLFLAMASTIWLRGLVSGASLRERWTAPMARRRLSGGLVILEFSAALILLVGAGLMGRTFYNLIRVDPGFDPANVLTFVISLPSSRYAETSHRLDFCQRTLTRLKSLPGVRAAAMDDSVPFAGWYSVWNMTALERSEPQPRDLDASVHSITPDYFRTLRIPLRSGRSFHEQDMGRDLKLVIVNEGLAQMAWPNESALGRHLILGRPEPDGTHPAYEVIGVVGNTLQSELAAEAQPSAYFAYSARFSDQNLGFLVRTDGDPEDLILDVRHVIRELDPALPVVNMGTMWRHMGETIDRQRLALILLGAFAILAVILVGVGVYGLMSYVTDQRSHEIGIRIAMGAQCGQVITMVLRQGMVLSGTGCAIGLLGAAGLARFLTSYLYGVSPTDPVTLLLISLFLCAVGASACYIPARRAARIDPMVALRYE